MKLRINYRGALLIFNPIIFILLLFAAHEAQALIGLSQKVKSD